MPRVLHHALSLTVAGEWAPLDELAAALDPELAERLPLPGKPHEPRASSLPEAARLALGT
jgi:hypothetical protein